MGWLDAIVSVVETPARVADAIVSSSPDTVTVKDVNGNDVEIPRQ